MRASAAVLSAIKSDLSGRTVGSGDVDLTAQLLHVHAPNQARNVAPDRVVSEIAVQHFVEGVFLAPALVENAIERADEASAVGAMLAVQQDRRLARGDTHGSQRRNHASALDIPGVDRKACEPQIKP